MQQQNEDIDVTLPSGERISAAIPAGLSDQQAKAFMRSRRPELFGAQPSATPFQVPSPGLRGSQTVQPSAGSSSASGVYEPSTAWTDYPKEIAKGIGRGVVGTAQGAYQTIRHPWDTVQGLAQQTIGMLDAGARSAESGENRAGQTLSMLENAPIIGGAVRYAESGGTKSFNPKSVGAGVELGTYYAAPKVAEGIVANAVPRGVEAFRARQAFNEIIAQSEGLGRQAKTLNAIDKGAQAVFNRAQEQVRTLQGRLRQDAQAAIQPAIDADKTAGQKPIVPIKAALDAHKAMESTGYVPSRAEQTLLDTLSETPEDAIAKKLGYPNSEVARADVGTNVFNDFVQRGAGGVQGNGLTLEKALQLRSMIGSAAAKARRAGNAKANMVLTSAYDGMNDAVNSRLNELEGKAGAIDASGKPVMNKAFEQYNKNHRAAFELEDGFTADLLDKPLDHHEARGKLGSFVDSNLTQVTKQMRDKGIDPNEFMHLQKDAKSVLAAHGSVMGKFNKGLYRQALSGGSEAALPLGIYMAAKGAGLYGFVPYMLATMTGKFSSGANAMMDFGNVLRRLNVSKSLLDTRTQPGPFSPLQFPGPQSPTEPQRGLPSVSGGSQAAAPTDVEEVRRRAPASEDVSQQAKALTIQNLKRRAGEGDFAAKRELRDREDREKGIPPVKEVSSFERQEKRAKIAKLKGVK